MIIFIILVNYTMASILKSTGWISNLKTWKKLLDQSMVSFLGVLILNFLVSDFVISQDFKEERDVLNKRSDLKIKFSALHEAYKANEEVIF